MGSSIRSIFIAVTLLLCATAPSAYGQIPGQGRLEGLEPSSIPSFEGTYEEGFENIVTLMDRYDGKGNVSLMKLGRMAMTMGKTVGRAGTAWTRKTMNREKAQYSSTFCSMSLFRTVNARESRSTLKYTTAQVHGGY